MQALSSVDGSAEAVREAAETALARGENRLALERELDRLNVAVQGSAAALESAPVVDAGRTVLPAGRLYGRAGGRLECASAWQALAADRYQCIFAVATVIATYFGLRAARDRVGPLKQHRQRVEEALERVAARPPAFARQGAITAALAQLRHADCRCWSVPDGSVSCSTRLALPITPEGRTAAISQRTAHQRGVDGAPTAPAKAVRSSVATTKGAPRARQRRTRRRSGPTVPRARRHSSTFCGVRSAHHRPLNRRSRSSPERQGHADQLGLRFSMKARTPSWAASSIMLQAIVWPAIW